MDGLDWIADRIRGLASKKRIRITFQGDPNKTTSHPVCSQYAIRVAEIANLGLHRSMTKSPTDVNPKLIAILTSYCPSVTISIGGIRKLKISRSGLGGGQRTSDALPHDSGPSAQQSLAISKISQHRENAVQRHDTRF